MADETKAPGHHDTTFATTAMLKAYAHPLRRRIAKVVAAREFARATDIAADLGVPANTVSFHLRVLADAGMLLPAPEHARDRRDRVWKAHEGSWSVGSPDNPIEDEQLGAVFLASLAEDHIEMVRRAVRYSRDYITGRESETHGMFSQFNLRLTEAEFTAMENRIADVIRHAQDSHDPDAPDTRFWNLDIVAADDTI